MSLAIAAAALQSLRENDDTLLLILSADHVISDIQEFHNAIELAERIVIKDKIATFGIKPSKPETGFGYIEVDNSEKTNFYINNLSFEGDRKVNNYISNNSHNNKLK